MLRFFALLFCPVFFAFAYEELANKIEKGCPQWMEKQIQSDLGSFRNRPISKIKMNELFEKSSEDLYLVKFIIRNNVVSTEKHFADSQNADFRIGSLTNALRQLGQTIDLPNVVFFYSIQDSLYNFSLEFLEQDLPIFVQCKMYNDRHKILIPDSYALGEKYQVIKECDITKANFPWERKLPQLMWRGSQDQHSVDYTTNEIRCDNLLFFSRIHLCSLSLLYPKLINAKMTIHRPELTSCLRPYLGRWVNFQQQSFFKYLMMTDGNASSFSESGWRFFVNSVVFKAESQLMQWYYNALEPYFHYIPVKEDLEDLVEKVQWARTHDAEAEKIAHNGKIFARTHLTLSDHLVYLYYLINEYASLNFVEE